MVQLSALRDLISNSTTDDWHRIEEGPSYLGWHVDSDDGTAHYEFHHNVAVYRGDVNLRLAWGLNINSNPISQKHYAPWIEAFTDPTVQPVFVDVLWRGALVDRARALYVDGGRACLPQPSTGQDGDGNLQQQVTPWTISITRLIHSITCSEDYDFYLSQAGFLQV